MQVTIPADVQIATGTYTGDGTDNKQITHGLGKIPQFAFVIEVDGAYQPGGSRAGIGMPSVFIDFGANFDQTTAWTVDYFYIPDAGAVELNENTKNFAWFAIA